MLGILSDIFEEFDRLCEENDVDKIKTIGDAYVVCAGALSEHHGGCGGQHDDDAARVVRMGLAMQEVVAAVREAEGIDIAVRTYNYTYDGDTSKAMNLPTVTGLLTMAVLTGLLSMAVLTMAGAHRRAHGPRHRRHHR